MKVRVRVGWSGLGSVRHVWVKRSVTTGSEGVSKRAHVIYTTVALMEVATNAAPKPRSLFLTPERARHRHKHVH